MRELVLTPKFRRVYLKAGRRDRVLQARIEDVLRQMQDDVFYPGLGTHKLSGALEGLWACSCGYDCRIVFALYTQQGTGREVIPAARHRDPRGSLLRLVKPLIVNPLATVLDGFAHSIQVIGRDVAAVGTWRKTPEVSP